MLKRIIVQSKFKFIIFSRTPILYITTYFFPLFSLYFFGKGYMNDVIEGYSFINNYLPLYIAIGMSAISVFTIGMDLVSKREKQLYKRISLMGCKGIEAFLSDIIFSIILTIPLCILLMIEAKILFGIQFVITNFYVIFPIIISLVILLGIAHFVFGLIDNSKIASPLQIAVFGFSLFGLGIIMPYHLLGESTLSFIKCTPYYYINRIMTIFWNADFSNNGDILFTSILYLTVFIIVIVVITWIIKKTYDSKSFKYIFNKK